MNQIISPIAIDMGAKNTGVYLNHFVQGEDPTTSGNRQGQTVVIDGSSITWSQVSRTQKRHQVRGNKRRKLAKRLLKVILAQHYKLSPTQTQTELLLGLMNRRGYTYLVEELDGKLIKKPVVIEYFVKNHGSFFGNRNTFFSDFMKLSNDISRCRDLRKKLTLSKNEAKKAVEEDKQIFADAYDNVKTALDKQIKAVDEGHKHRSDYLQNIKKDISENEILKPLLGGDLSAECLANLIGNISNLQLRILRKYFNESSMKNGDQWIPRKLHILFFKWVRGWHCQRDRDEEKSNRNALMKLQGKDILDVLTTSSPERTIPPYEDQNNRIKESIRDKTLRLKPSGLDSKMPNWREVTKSIIANYCYPTDDSRVTRACQIDENIEECTHKNIRKVDEDFESRKLANVLQRVFDRSRELDPYKLRLLCSLESLDALKDGDLALEAVALLKKHIGNGNLEKFLKLGNAYYEEEARAKQGLWSESDDSLFFCCNTNPPHKSNLQHKLIGHIVGENLSKEDIKEFVEECWNDKIGRKTVKSSAQSVEETRKVYGNEFNFIAERVRRRRWVCKNKPNEVTDEQNADWKKYEKEHKDVVDAAESADAVAKNIAEYFRHDDRQQQRYNNSFSVAQLYNHLETDIGGFSKTDKWNTEENAWRSQMDPKVESANATRLAKDSVRPFDGMLGRILERQAWEIAQYKIAQLENLGVKEEDDFFVPILLEQNKFNFEESLHDVKRQNRVKIAKKTEDRVKKGKNRQDARWRDKDTRIKGNKICPYTGEQIGRGEIDHIIPQSASKQRSDVVFNSEANLIYCSGAGNHKKGDKRWKLSDLHSAYLREVFGTENLSEIESKIRNFVENRLDPKNFSGFHNLEPQEQNYLRHALFIQELDAITFPLLNTRYKNLVNGTQAYLAKLLVKAVRAQYPNAQCKAFYVDAYEVHAVRDLLGAEYKKGDAQGAFSHVIDAALVLAAALQQQKIAEELQTTNFAEIKQSQAEWLQKLLPDSGDVKKIERRPKYRKDISSTPIFKETIYGERFMSILLDNGKIYRGFEPDNRVVIHPLGKGAKASEKQKSKHQEYFDLLKEFLYTGSLRRKNKQPVVGSLDEYQGKFTYLAVDKAKALAHLQKCAKQVCSDREVEQAKHLNELRYCVEKKSIQSVLITGRGKARKFISQDELKKKFKMGDLELPAQKDWERLLNLSITDNKGNAITLKDCLGQLAQIEVANEKMKNFWETLSQESGIAVATLRKELLKINTATKELFKPETIIPKGVFEGKLKENDKLVVLEDNPLLQNSFEEPFMKNEDQIPSDSWEKLFNEFFHSNKNGIAKAKITRSHKPVRKVWSLPVVSNPSGGFRIKRKNPVTGEDVYQVSSADGYYAKGKNSELTEDILIDALQESGSVAPVHSTVPEISDSSVCYFDEWRKIEVPDDLQDKLQSLSYAINSKDRFRIRVVMAFDVFRNLMPLLGDWKTVAPAISVNGRDWKKFISSELLGKPRSNLFIEKVSEKEVTFSYIVDSTNKKMRDEYQKGTPL